MWRGKWTWNCGVRVRNVLVRRNRHMCSARSQWIGKRFGILSNRRRHVRSLLYLVHRRGCTRKGSRRKACSRRGRSWNNDPRTARIQSRFFITWFGKLRKGKLFGYLVKVGVHILGTTSAGVGTLHLFKQVRKAPKEEFVVVRVSIHSLGRDSLEAPAIRLTNETGILGVIKVGRNHLDFEFPRLVNLPTSSMWHPADNVREFGSRKDGKQLCRKIGNSAWNSHRLHRIWIWYLGIVLVCVIGRLHCECHLRSSITGTTGIVAFGIRGAFVRLHLRRHRVKWKFCSDLNVTVNEDVY